MENRKGIDKQFNNLKQLYSCRWMLFWTSGIKSIASKTLVLLSVNQGERGTCDNRENTELCGRVGGGERQWQETMGAKGISEGIDTVEVRQAGYRR
jgi:hypothetical protein